MRGGTRSTPQPQVRAPVRTVASAFVGGVVSIGALGVVMVVGGVALGLFPIEATGHPSRLEVALARTAIDATLRRRASRTRSPLPRADSILLSGLRIYRNNCGGCHGDGRSGPSQFGLAFYPPAPQFSDHPPGRPEWQMFYIVRHGIRRTGMAAWQSIMPDDSIWRVVRFVSELESLPPTVAQSWRGR